MPRCRCSRAVLPLLLQILSAVATMHKYITAFSYCKSSHTKNCKIMYAVDCNSTNSQATDWASSALASTDMFRLCTQFCHYKLHVTIAEGNHMLRCTACTVQLSWTTQNPDRYRLDCSDSILLHACCLHYCMQQQHDTHLYLVPCLNNCIIHVNQMETGNQY